VLAILVAWRLLNQYSPTTGTIDEEEKPREKGCFSAKADGRNFQQLAFYLSGIAKV